LKNFCGRKFFFVANFSAACQKSGILALICSMDKALQAELQANIFGYLGSVQNVIFFLSGMIPVTII
jgi:hypothetical protein